MLTEDDLTPGSAAMRPGDDCIGGDGCIGSSDSFFSLERSCLHPEPNKSALDVLFFNLELAFTCDVSDETPSPDPPHLVPEQACADSLYWYSAMI